MSVAGVYEYIKPSSGDKSTQTLVLNDDHTCSYSEVSSNTMKDWTSEGNGTWRIENHVAIVVIDTLVTNTRYKIMTVPGINSGESVSNNAVFPIPEGELLNAPRSNASHKWRIKQ